MLFNKLAIFRNLFEVYVNKMEEIIQ